MRPRLVEKELHIEGTDLDVALPLAKAVQVTWPPSHAGKIKHGGAMGMMVSGVMIVD